MSNKKEKMLLIEACEFAPQVTLSNELKESIKLAAGKNDTLIIRNVPCTILNRKNLNGRIYSTEVVQQAINEAQDKIKQKQLLSQACEHPEGSFVSPTTASHVVVAAYIKKNTRIKVESEDIVQDVLFMDLEILNTQEGKNLRALIEGGCSVGTSIRGLGDLDGDQVVEYDLLGVDFVGNPSSSTFTNMLVNESVKVESADSRKLDENYVVASSSTNVVRDLESAASIQAKLDDIGYGTVTKTSTKVDDETNPKTGATTTLITLEAETSDEVTDIDQALMMAKKAMLNPLVHVDSISIEKKEEDGETKEAAPEEISDVIEEDTVKKDGKWVNKGSEGTHGEFDTKKAADAQRKAMFANGYGESEDEEDYISEEVSIKESTDDKDVKPRKFVLKTQNGYVAMNGNAINFVRKPSEAIQFIEGKEDSGMVHLSNIEKILDTMGLYDVQRYYKKEGKKSNPNASKKQEGLIAGDINVSTGDIASGNDVSLLPENNVLDGTPAKNIAGQPEVNMTEETGKYTAVISSQKGEDTVPVTAVEYEGVIGEISNLYDMKASSLGEINMVLINNETGERFEYDPVSKSLKNIPVSESSDDTTEVEDNKVTMKVDDDVSVEKEFDTPQQARLAKAGIDNGKIDPAVMVKEDGNNKRYVVIMENGENSYVFIYKSGNGFEFIRDFEIEDENTDINDISFASKEEADKLVSELDPNGYLGMSVSEIDVPMNEKLYKEPSDPSDPYVEKPLKDATEDEDIDMSDKVQLTISNIDWDISKEDLEDFAGMIHDENKSVEEVFEQLVTNLPENLKIQISPREIKHPETMEQEVFMIATTKNDLPPIKDADIEVEA